jgi:hypothetical protein
MGFAKEWHRRPRSVTVPSSNGLLSRAAGGCFGRDDVLGAHLIGQLALADFLQGDFGLNQDEETYLKIAEWITVQPGAKKVQYCNVVRA